MDPRDTAGLLMRKGVTKSEIIEDDVDKAWGAIARGALKYGKKLLPKAKKIAVKAKTGAKKYGASFKAKPFKTAGKTALGASETSIVASALTPKRKRLTAKEYNEGIEPGIIQKPKQMKNKASGYKIGGK